MEDALIGEKIKHYRKLKKITLQELSDGICSIGKMSYIENGVSTASEEEIAKIAQKLGVPVSYIINKEKDEVATDIKTIYMKIDDLLFAGLHDAAKKEITNITKVVKNKSLSGRKYDEMNNYVWGKYYVYTGNFIKAIIKLKESLQYKVNTKQERMLRIKTLLLLSNIYYLKSDYSESLACIQQALELSPAKQEQIRNKIELNLVILLLLTGKKKESLFYYSQLNKSLDSAIREYLGAVFDYFNGNYMRCIEVTKKLKEQFKSEQNIEMFFRAIALLTLVEGKEYNNDYANYILDLVSKVKDYNILANNIAKSKITLDVIHFYSYLALQKDRISIAFSLLKVAQQLSQFRHYLTDYLLFQYYKKIDQDKKEQESYLLSAIAKAPQAYVEKIAVMYYELAELRGDSKDQNNGYIKAVEAFYAANRTCEIFTLETILPNPLW